MASDFIPEASMADDLGLATVTNETLYEALNDLHAALGQWASVGATEESDSDDIDDAGALVLHRLKAASDVLAGFANASRGLRPAAEPDAPTG